MKKTYLIIGSSVFLAILIGFWVYSFLYGSPTNTTDSLFTNLGIFGSSDANPELIVPPVPSETPLVDVASERLRQLTTKPVIGARDVSIASTTIMRYVEAGTGHIYDINLSNGQEVRVSPISVPMASEAVISPSGEYVAIRSGSGNQNTVTIITISNGGTPLETPLPNQVEDMAFAYNNEFLFTEISGGQTEIKGYTVGNAAVRRLGTAPFTSATMSWSSGSNTPHIVYTRPAASLIGYAYELTASGLRRLPFSGNGLMILQQSNNILFSRSENGTLQSYVYTKSSDSYSNTAVAVIPTKCTIDPDVNFSFFCASPISLPPNNLPDDWLSGGIAFNDRLWQLQTGSANQLTYPLDEVGRSVDVMSPKTADTIRMVYFTNKNDKTLWAYDL